MSAARATMEREEQNPAPNGARSNQVDRLRLLVTLQNQIVELAQRNALAQQDCVRLSQEIALQVQRRNQTGGRKLVAWLRLGGLTGWLKGLAKGGANGFQRPEGRTRPDAAESRRASLAEDGMANSRRWR